MSSVVLGIIVAVALFGLGSLLILRLSKRYIDTEKSPNTGNKKDK